MRFFIAIFLLFNIFAVSASEFIPSVDVFLRKYTRLVKGKKVGLITNQSAVTKSGELVIDVLVRHPDVNIVALFAPEHGVRGTVPAGMPVNNTRDEKTGLPVYSTYHAKTKQPSPEHLKKVDILIFAIQDLGCKTYTYIWTMAECMKAAGRLKIPMIILDMPSVHGLNYPDGPIRLPKYRSFIGLYPTPYTYDATEGELARYLKHVEKIDCKLYIVPMHYYRRGMTYAETGLKFRKLSPNIPDLNSALGYWVTGPLGELGLFNIGLNMGVSFQIIAAPWLNGQQMASFLNRAGIPGIKFEPYNRKAIFGRYKGEYISGVKLVFTDSAKVRPVETIIRILCYMRDYESDFHWNTSSPSFNNIFDKAIGSDFIRLQIQKGVSASSIIRQYRAESNSFARKLAPYRIYK
ncbi:MAG: DUF1343 domain-containing protein [Lentisphaeria bacterium]|nr:DUF1343 domain-containing protein [Lentisphaeria bacterium]